MIGDKIKLLRTERNMSQKELAKAISISASAIGMYEQKRRFPDIDTVIRLSSFFHVSTDYLLLEDCERPLSADEIRWLKLYREIPPEERTECVGFIKGYVSRSRKQN